MPKPPFLTGLLLNKNLTDANVIEGKQLYDQKTPLGLNITGALCDEVIKFVGVLPSKEYKHDLEMVIKAVDQNKDELLHIKLCAENESLSMWSVLNNSVEGFRNSKLTPPFLQFDEIFEIR